MQPGGVIAQIVVALAVSPLLNGLIKTTKARLQGRRGPGLGQPYADLLKFLARESVVSEQASWVFRAAPLLSFGALLTTAALTPMWAARSPLAGVGDVILLLGLFALARFALALAAIDTASNFGGMGASREIAFATLVEPGLVLLLFALALPAGSTSLTALIAPNGVQIAHVLAGIGLMIIVIAETGRIPVDNPDTHLELTMVHEGMLLEYAGHQLGLLLWATLVKQLVVLSLFLALVAPWGMARGDSPGAAALLLGLLGYAGKLALLGVALAVIETGFAKLRIFRVPDLLGSAAVFGVLALVAGYVTGGAH